MKPDVFLSNRVAGRQFSPLAFNGDATKKADGLHGCNVFMRCRLEVVGLNTRGECMIVALQEIERDPK